MSFVSTYSAASIRAWQTNPTEQGWYFSKTLNQTSNVAQAEIGYSTGISDDASQIIVGTRGLTYITVYQGPSFSSFANLTTTNATATFGIGISINGDGNIIAAGDSSGSNVTIFSGSNISYLEIQKLSVPFRNLDLNKSGNTLAIQIPNNISIYNFDGNSNSYIFTSNITGVSPGILTTVCKLSKDGDYCLGANIQTNQVFVNKLTGNVWAIEQTITPNNGVVNDRFGSSGDINQYGNVIIIGAPFKTINGNTNAGCAYVFKKTGNTWIQNQILLPNDSEAQQTFAAQITMLYDGNTIMLSTSADDTGNILNSGAVYVFQNINNTYVETQKIISPNVSTQEFFGFSTSLAKNGYYAVIGAPGHDTPTSNVGITYFYNAT